MSAQDLSMLNEPQREAVLMAPRPLVIFAGAGSGKTRVITHRMVEFMRTYKMAPYRIMAVTFTNKAAHEMRERVAALEPGAVSDLCVGTFHSISARLLRRHAREAGLDPRFVIYDDADQRAMITRVLRDFKLDEKRFPPRLLQSIIGRAKNEMESLDNVAIGGFDEPQIRAILLEYQVRMDRAGALDFGDLIYRFARALEHNTEFRDRMAQRFQAVLVDEFQDTNHAQLRLVRSLASVHQNITVVGDDDQSIYKWRGADRRNILDFRRHFDNAGVIKLEQNYRSTARILACSHSVIEQNSDREPKKLFTENPAGNAVAVMRCSDERQEATFVAALATERRASGASLRELAVLYRTHAQSRVLEERLRAQNIPYRIVGGVRFFDRAEVKDLLAYLRALVNPNDDVSVLRIINTPTRGIGKTTIDRLLDLAVARAESVQSVMATLDDDRAYAKVREFYALLESLRAHLGRPEATLLDVTRAVLDESGYRAQLVREDSAESDARLLNLDELLGALEEFEETVEPTLALDERLSAFLETVSLDPSQEQNGDGDQDCVTLMTVHAAKGLEFDTVVVAGLEEQLFPFRSPDGERDTLEDLEEERRLAYVAFTRAKAMLYLTFASTRYVFGNLRLGQPSPFLLCLPPADVVWTNLSGEGRSGFTGRSSSPPPRVADGESKNGWVSASLSGSLLYRSDSERPPPRPAVAPSSLARGMRVSHVRYGAGVIEKVGEGVPPRVEVRFDSVGAKHILATFLQRA